MAKKVLILVRKGPYGTVHTTDAFRSISGLSVFGLQVSALFSDDGVYTLMKNQEPSGILMGPLDKGLKPLKDFGAKIYVTRECLQMRGISEEEIEDVCDRIIERSDAVTLLRDSDVVIPY